VIIYRQGFLASTCCKTRPGPCPRIDALAVGGARGARPGPVSERPKFRRSERTESRPQPARVHIAITSARARETETDHPSCRTNTVIAVSLAGDKRERGFRMPR
jgi:hypothetical protein